MVWHARHDRLGASRRDRRVFAVPAYVAGTYAFFSALWIVFSDQLLALFARDYAQYQLLQTYKGTAFITASSLVIFFTLRGAWQRLASAWALSHEHELRMQLALESADGGIWEIDLSSGHPELAFVADDIRPRLGLPENQPVTLAMLDALRHPDDAERVDRALAEAAASDGSHPYDVRYRMRAADDTWRWVHARGRMVADASGQPARLLGVTIDVTEQMRAAERVDRLLRFDPLTGLPKQAKFLADVDDALAAAGEDAVLGIAQLRLPGLGHLIGATETVEDAAVIRAIGDRLLDLAASGIIASRIATNVFAIATPALDAPGDVHAVLAGALDALSEPMLLQGVAVRLRFETGGALAPHDGSEARALLVNAGLALDNPDRLIDTPIRWFTAGLDAEFRRRTERQRDLGQAAARGEIECHLQPLVDLGTGRIAGFEALARWRRPGEGLVMPDQFIGLAEQQGCIREIGAEILRQACRAAAGWPESGGPAPYVAVNVSPLQLDDPAFPAQVARILAETGLSPHRLELEITETALVGDTAIAARRLAAFRDVGIAVAIDDFGTGQSSLSTLGRLPFSRLKIDKSFVADLGRRDGKAPIIDMIIGLGASLGLAITAEGIETPEQAEALASRGVATGQGFLFARPVLPADAERLIATSFPVHRPRAVRNA